MLSHLKYGQLCIYKFMEIVQNVKAQLFFQEKMQKQKGHCVSLFISRVPYFPTILMHVKCLSFIGAETVR